MADKEYALPATIDDLKAVIRSLKQAGKKGNKSIADIVRKSK